MQKKRKKESLPERESLPEFKMSITEAISYIKARTCLLEWLQDGYTIGSERYQLRKGLNNRLFILNASDDKLELFIQVKGWAIQGVIEAFDQAVSIESTERGILPMDLDAVRLVPKKYKK
jgi:hypothetical protein